MCMQGLKWVHLHLYTVPMFNQLLVFKPQRDLSSVHLVMLSLCKAMT